MTQLLNSIISLAKVRKPDVYLDQTIHHFVDKLPPADIYEKLYLIQQKSFDHEITHQVFEAVKNSMRHLKLRLLESKNVEA